MRGEVSFLQIDLIANYQQGEIISLLTLQTECQVVIMKEPQGRGKMLIKRLKDCLQRSENFKTERDNLILKPKQLQTMLLLIRVRLKSMMYIRLHIQLIMIMHVRHFKSTDKGQNHKAPVKFIKLVNTEFHQHLIIRIHNTE